MTTNVALSGAMRSNLLSLVNTQRDVDTIQNRLATGRKVNSALDDPRNFFAAQSLNNRAGDLNRLLDSMGQSISTIKEADNGVSSLTKLLEQADSLAIQAKEELTKAQGQAIATGDENIGDETNLVDLAGIDDNATFTLTDRRRPSSGNIVIEDGDSAEMLVAKINNSDLEGKIEASLDESGQLQIKSLVDDASIRIEAGVERRHRYVRGPWPRRRGDHGNGRRRQQPGRRHHRRGQYPDLEGVHRFPASAPAQPFTTPAS